MNDGFVNKDNVIFERLNMAMQQHLKLLYISSKVDGIRINKVHVDY